MLKHCLIHRHSVPSVPHNFISFNPETNKFHHTKTGDEITVSSDDFDKIYAGWFLLTTSVILVDRTIVDSNQLLCDPRTGRLVNKNTNQPVQLQPNQVHFVAIDHQNPPETNYNLISDDLYANLRKNQGKLVSVKQIYNEFWDGPFYTVNYERIPSQSINFDDLILTKVVYVPNGDTHFFYSMRSPTYNSFGSTILFKLVEE
jgi:hypothetical protein